ncbi:MAG: hypothetical protein EXR79_05395 [Myxococcales bacterium]|nr:hypothetical protein [Myxococcales bacterium]
MSFDLPSLFMGFVFSTFGFALFRWGKKQARALHIAGGVVLMVAPYFCPSAGIMVVVCGGVGLGVYGMGRLGW